MNAYFSSASHSPITAPIPTIAMSVLSEVVRGRTLTFYTDTTYIKLCELLAKIKEESTNVIGLVCKRSIINRTHNKKLGAVITISKHVNMINHHHIYITNIYAYKIQQFIKYAIEKSRYNKVKAIALLVNRCKTVLNSNNYRHKRGAAIIIKNSLINSCNYKKYKQMIEKVKVLQVRYKMHYNKKVKACVKIQLLWIRYSKMKRSVIAQNAILQKRNSYLENKVIELELQMLKLNSLHSVNLVTSINKEMRDIGTHTYSNDIYTEGIDDTGIIGFTDSIYGYIKVDIDKKMEDEIKIKKLEEDIKNIIDDRIKLLTVIDTITKENRTMYRHIQNSSKSWFSRIFN
jgi:hypothetical protein